jgi:hypothetical protein
MAQAGFWTGLVGSVLGVLGLILVVLVFAWGSTFTDDLDGFEENCRVVNPDGTSSPC